MSDFKAIIDAVKGIEATLVEQFGAEGRGLHEKLSSVEAHVPSSLQRSIRYLATVRNKAMHEDGYEIENPDDYVRQAIEARAQLVALGKPTRSAATATPHRTAVPNTPNKLLVLLIAALMIGGAWYAASAIQSRSSSASASVNGSDATAVPTSGGSAPLTDAVGAADMTLTTGAAGSLRDAIAAGHNVGLGNDALRIDAVEFAAVTGAWGRATPQISLTVTNIANKTVASARAQAMLFINGHDAPVVQAKDLFVYLDQQGLQSGATRTVKISMDREFDWGAPDVLNARQRAVAVRITSSDDGMSRAFGGSAPPLPWKVSKPPLNAASGQVQDVDMRAQIAAGLSVGAGNAAVLLGTPTIKVGAGSFGRDMEISVEIENTSQRTVSSVTADALLFINGNPTPAVGDREAVRFYLGERGLAAGERKRFRATIDHFKSFRWAVPDVMNASSRLLVLRVASTEDGMRNPFGGAGKPIPWEIPK